MKIGYITVTIQPLSGHFMYWRKSFLLPLLLAIPMDCLAADKPETGPVPSWVTPTVSAPGQKTPDVGPLHILLSDQQIWFHGQTTSTYVASSVKIAKPEGLAAMGTIALQWKPDTDRVTVHKLRIIRDGREIDVLKSAQNFTILRRENNLELSMIDGTLTATLPLEGLQVGDVIELAYTLERTEPLLQGRHDLTVHAGTVGSIERLNIAAHWEPDTAMRHQSQNLPVSLQQRGDSVTLQADMVDPLIIPQGAPSRFRRGRQIEFSDFRNWGEVSAIFSPLFNDARQLIPNSPIFAEIEKIKAQSPDPVRRAGAALALVEDNVRYLYVGLNQSNLKPTAADVTWKNRFGDCKAKTALLLAILDHLGIAAEPALISVAQGDGLDQRLPNVGQFDHVIVRTIIDTKTYWLDATRTGDKGIEALRVPDWHWALPIHVGSDHLEALVVPVEKRPTVLYNLQLDASKGISLPALADGEIAFRGDAGFAVQLALASVPKSQREATLRSIWTKQYDFITPEKMTDNWDDVHRIERLTMHGTAKMDWNLTSKPPYYEVDGSSIGWRGDYHRDSGPDSDAPFAINYPDYAEYRENIILPGDGWGFSIQGSDIDQTIAQRSLFRKTEMNGNVVTLIAWQRPLAPELAYADGQAADETLRQLAKSSVYINADYSKIEMTKEEALSFLSEPTPSDEPHYIRRLLALTVLLRYSDGLAEAERFVAAFPKSEWALAYRAQFNSLAGHHEAARNDAAAALAIAPDNAFAKIVQHYYDVIDKRDKEHLSNINILAAFKAGAAESCFKKNEYKCVIVQAGRALEIQPTLSDLYVLRANAYRGLNQPDEATGEADKMVKVAPKDAKMLAVAGVIYCSTGHVDKGLKVFSDSIAIMPTVTAYLNRIRWWPADDQAGKKRDIDAALKLAPQSPDVLLAFADWQRDNDDRAAETATLQSIQIDSGNDMHLKLHLGSRFAQIGQTDKAKTIYAEVRGFAAGSRNAGLYNNLCYTAAGANFELETALADCQQADEIAPNNYHIQDSLGFVELKLGRYDDAITSYGKALSAMPKEYDSLYGRGIAYLRKGNKNAADTDIKAAIAGQPNIVAEFKKMGITQ